MNHNNKKLNRRDFLKASAVTVAAVSAGLNARPTYAAKKKRAAMAKKVIVIGVDGMDSRLAEKMMSAGKLPNFARLHKMGGYSKLGTSIPPQSPVAWANFINGAGPGSHGIFDFIHRNPEYQCAPFFSAAETIPGKGFLEIGEHKLQLDFWPFNHEPPATLLRRQGIPFWDYLDQADISSTFYNLPSNYPPQRIQTRPPSMSVRYGRSGHLGNIRNLSAFCRRWPNTIKRRKRRQALHALF